jgi:homocysteine S-methyltransferase
VFDVAAFERFLKRVEPMGLPIIVGIWPFESALNAEFMANEVPGVTVPDALVERMRKTTSAAAAAAEGVLVAREIVTAIKGMAAGVQISTPSGRLDAALDVLDVV